MAEDAAAGSSDQGDQLSLAHSSQGPSAGCKLFLGGLSWSTTEDKLREYFSQYGAVEDVVVMKDRFSRQPRGFGFITFSDPAAADRATQETHSIDGRTIDAKPSVPHGQSDKPRSRKIFVGGLSSDTNEEQFKAYFSRFGPVAEGQIMMDYNSGRSRGFGFITFEEEASVHRVFAAGHMHTLNNKQVEVKSATPKGSGPQPIIARAAMPIPVGLGMGIGMMPSMAAAPMQLSFTRPTVATAAAGGRAFGAAGDGVGLMPLPQAAAAGVQQHAGFAVAGNPYAAYAPAFGVAVPQYGQYGQYGVSVAAPAYAAPYGHAYGPIAMAPPAYGGFAPAFSAAPAVSPGVGGYAPAAARGAPAGMGPQAGGGNGGANGGAGGSGAGGPYASGHQQQQGGQQHHHQGGPGSGHGGRRGAVQRD